MGEKRDKITELDDKYLVLKWRDIKEGLNDERNKTFADLLRRIDAYRRLVKEKPVNKYVVLNLDDELNINYLMSCLLSHQKQDNPYVSVKDIAVDLVNAILIAGNPKH